MGFAPGPVGQGFDLGKVVLGGVSKALGLGRSDPVKDQQRCATAAQAVTAARNGTQLLVNGVGHDPETWVRSQAANSGSDAGKQCYAAALSQIQAIRSGASGGAGAQLSSVLPTSASGMLIAVVVLTIVGIGAVVVFRKAGRPA